MIKAIFFATFDVHEGPKVHYQVPPNSVQPSPTSAAIPLFNFSPLANYIIPALPLSNRPLQLLTPTKPHHRILSHPVTIQGEQYARNAFTFNFCLVLEEETGFHSYLPVVSKLANLFRHLEEQGRFLSTELSHLYPSDNSNGGGLFSNSKRSSSAFVRGEEPGSQPAASASSSSSSRIHAICEILLEDLNNYSECMIPITSTTTTLNIKLFPIYPSPPPLYPHQVPLLTVSLTDMIDPATWDITLLRILPYINGVNSVKRISFLADTDLKLVRKAVRELLYYGCATLLDIFSFGAIYAGTPALAGFVAGEDEETRLMREECLRYVSIPVLAGAPVNSSISHLHHHHHRPFSTGRAGGGPSLLSSTLGHSKTTTSHTVTATTGPTNTSSAAAASSTTPTPPIPIKPPIALKNPIPSPPSASNSPYPHSHPYPQQQPNANAHPNPTSTTLPSNSPHQIPTLYLSLTPSLPLRKWIETQDPALIKQIDIRRFITFGVIKGLVYRVHRYAVSAHAVRMMEERGRGGGGGGGGGGGAHGQNKSGTNGAGSAKKGGTNAGIPHCPHSPKSKSKNKKKKRGSLPGAGATTSSIISIISAGDVNEDGDGDAGAEDEEEDELHVFLDGTHSFDEICTELMISERELMGRLKEAWADVVVINR